MRCELCFKQIYSDDVETRYINVEDWMILINQEGTWIIEDLTEYCKKLAYNFKYVDESELELIQHILEDIVIAIKEYDEENGIVADNFLKWLERTLSEIEDQLNKIRSF